MLLMLPFLTSGVVAGGQLAWNETTRERKGMPPRSSIGKRIVRRPASYEEEPDSDDGERLARVIVTAFALVPKKGPGRYRV
jgi:hypothetical protein